MIIRLISYRFLYSIFPPELHFYFVWVYLPDTVTFNFTWPLFFPTSASFELSKYSVVLVFCCSLFFYILSALYSASFKKQPWLCVYGQVLTALGLTGRYTSEFVSVSLCRNDELQSMFSQMHWVNFAFENEVFMYSIKLFIYTNCSFPWYGLFHNWTPVICPVSGSQCTRSCGTGTRERRVVCMDLDQNQYGDERCSPQSKPHSMENCNTQQCPGTQCEYLWQKPFSDFSSKIYYINMQQK